MHISTCMYLFIALFFYKDACQDSILLVYTGDFQLIAHGSASWCHIFGCQYLIGGLKGRYINDLLYAYSTWHPKITVSHLWTWVGYNYGSNDWQLANALVSDRQNHYLDIVWKTHRLTKAKHSDVVSSPVTTNWLNRYLYRKQPYPWTTGC